VPGTKKGAGLAQHGLANSITSGQVTFCPQAAVSLGRQIKNLKMRVVEQPFPQRNFNSLRERGVHLFRLAQRIAASETESFRFVGANLIFVLVGERGIVIKVGCATLNAKRRQFYD